MFTMIITTVQSWRT